MHIVTYELQEELTKLGEASCDRLALATELVLAMGGYASSIQIKPTDSNTFQDIFPGALPPGYEDVGQRFLASKLAGEYLVEACFFSRVWRTCGDSHLVANRVSYDYAPSRATDTPGKLIPYAASMSPLPTRDRLDRPTRYELPETHLTLAEAADAVSAALSVYVSEGVPPDMQLTAIAKP